MKGKSYSPLALALLPTENQIFMACLDAHLYEIEYRYKKCPRNFFVVLVMARELIFPLVINECPTIFIIYF
jgi:hypothetical protein